MRKTLGQVAVSVRMVFAFLVYGRKRRTGLGRNENYYYLTETCRMQRSKLPDQTLPGKLPGCRTRQGTDGPLNFMVQLQELRTQKTSDCSHPRS